ncbi:NADH-quinone oxidoreductase subunit A [Dyadobacter jejuensis]|uniref:NADH-quinone oxidoreductase subunit A n=1 Tax=Dyadobacter jejuensis TaxID=1082580 RepID=A0A316BC93_9BACT|nr:NADH-quinone oxidoreductase subunit A [Dyadobacter jejuensis]PWJ60097.1 NADH-quinone oxidoreductase subunit A [Dyadobacter jejuensis]
MPYTHTALTPDWSFWIYALLVGVLLTFILTLSYFLGQQNRSRAVGQPYESGILPTGTARLRFSAQFYLVAMLFVIFDLEVVFIVLWALAFKELGWAGYVGISVFIGLLFAVLLYEWRIGALDFGPNGKRILKAYKKRILNQPEL